MGTTEPIHESDPDQAPDSSLGVCLAHESGTTCPVQRLCGARQGPRRRHLRGRGIAAFGRAIGG
jgi:hypothetical protein